jgi:predicted RNase H-like nuclease
MHNLYYSGIDGCRGGWLFTTIDGEGKFDIHLFPKIKDAVTLIEKSIEIAIDMPIGLINSPNEIRGIDIQIRKELGHPFSSSVFTVPCKQAVYADDFQDANSINKEILGKGISIQAWNICSKIKELDQFLIQHSMLKSKFKETHPELCFKNLKGESLNYKKKTSEGFKERLNLLAAKFPGIEDVYKKARSQFRKKDVADDDVLDSMVLANSVLSFPYK